MQGQHTPSVPLTVLSTRVGLLQHWDGGMRALGWAREETTTRVEDAPTYFRLRMAVGEARGAEFATQRNAAFQTGRRLTAAFTVLSMSQFHFYACRWPCASSDARS